MDTGYLYIIHTRQFIDTNTNVFKIGKSIDPLVRKSGYAKGSKLLFICFCNYIKIIEDRIKLDFKIIFTHRPDHGSEYFQGCFKKMRKEMLKKIIDLFDNYEIGESNYPTSPIKTLQHFVDETIEVINNYNVGINFDDIHDFYMKSWLPDNQVDIAYINKREFLDKITKFIGKPIEQNKRQVFLGKKIKGKEIYPISDIFGEFVYANLIREDNFHLDWSKVKNRLFNWLDNKDAKSRTLVKSKKIPEMQQALTKYLGKWNRTYIDYQYFCGYIGWNMK